MTPAELKTKRESMPCVACGESSYTWGDYHGAAAFKEDSASALSKFFRQPSALRTRCCNACGNLQMFTPRRIDAETMDSAWSEAR